MTKFRLKMARQLGEQIAKQHGFKSFPIDPLYVAKENEILVQAKPPEHEGVSGCIIFNGEEVGIIYSTKINNKGFINFTIAHELGHYFIDGHPEEITKTSPVHVSKAGFSQGDNSIEIEADHFAAGMLLPTQLTKIELENTSIGLEGIISLASKAKCSITAAAIRASECASFPIAIVISQGKLIRYSFLSESFKNLKPLVFLRKGDYLPQTATKSFNENVSLVYAGENRCSESEFSEWFGSQRPLKLDEEILGLGKYGLTLTVLSSEEIYEDPYEYEDIDEKLEDSWTPKFAYGR